MPSTNHSADKKVVPNKMLQATTLSDKSGKSKQLNLKAHQTMELAS